MIEFDSYFFNNNIWLAKRSANGLEMFFPADEQETVNRMLLLGFRYSTKQDSPGSSHPFEFDEMVTLASDHKPVIGTSRALMTRYKFRVVGEQFEGVPMDTRLFVHVPVVSIYKEVRKADK